MARKKKVEEVAPEVKEPEVQAQVENTPEEVKLDPKLEKLMTRCTKKAAFRSARNLEALRRSFAFTPTEQRELKEELVELCKKIAQTSGPVINMEPGALLRFFNDGEFKPFGDSGLTNGTADKELRAEYSERVYGYPSLEGAEKYGLIPVWEVDEASPILELPMYKRPGARYGKLSVHLKASVGARTTMNVMDSGNQWGEGFELRRFGNIYPVPYRMENPEGIVGCLLAVPTENELREIEERGPRREQFIADIRQRVLDILALLKGLDLKNYVEAHIHGPVSVDDIDFVEYDGNAVVSEPSWKSILSFGEKVKLVDVTAVKDEKPEEQASEPDSMA